MRVVEPIYTAPVLGTVRTGRLTYIRGPGDELIGYTFDDAGRRTPDA